MEFGNNEGALWVDSVRVHETDHGYAQAFAQDLQNPNFLKHLSLDGVVTFLQGSQRSGRILNCYKTKKLLQRPHSAQSLFVNPVLNSRSSNLMQILKISRDFLLACKARGVR
ncbi:6-pyruvoyl tetrahydrobiopterin synthase [Helicobacter mustelae]|nr:6-pyruvoyl tetrahydrobiopterin synthase [Helicobacter mustelae]